MVEMTTGAEWTMAQLLLWIQKYVNILHFNRTPVIINLTLIFFFSDFHRAFCYRLDVERLNCMPLQWESGCVQVKVSRNLNQLITQDFLSDHIVEQIIDRSISNWNTHLKPYGLVLKYLQSDEINASTRHIEIEFVSDNWIYSSAATGYTAIEKSDMNGMLTSVRIYLNNSNFQFVDYSGSAPKSIEPRRYMADLENTLTHELGHSLGLAHNCDDSSPSDRCKPLIGGGELIACGSVMESARNGNLYANTLLAGTMYPYVSLDNIEIEKRNIKQDELNALAGLYSRRPSDQATCEASAPSGCAYVKSGTIAPKVDILLISEIIIIILYLWKRKYQHSLLRFSFKTEIASQ